MTYDPTTQTFSIHITPKEIGIVLALFRTQRPQLIEEARPLLLQLADALQMLREAAAQ